MAIRLPGQGHLMCSCMRPEPGTPVSTHQLVSPGSCMDPPATVHRAPLLTLLPLPTNTPTQPCINHPKTSCCGRLPLPDDGRAMAPRGGHLMCGRMEPASAQIATTHEMVSPGSCKNPQPRSPDARCSWPHPHSHPSLHTHAPPTQPRVDHLGTPCCWQLHVAGNGQGEWLPGEATSCVVA
jgi:hypothetical protein